MATTVYVDASTKLSILDPSFNEKPKSLSCFGM